MELNSKIKAKTQDAVGAAKIGIGKATGNKQLQASGRKDKQVSRLKQTGERIKNAFRR
jgi:uncharacterized protein YjbJ (UPF0337 family)